MALDPPTQEEWEKMRRDGTLKERIASAYAIGNNRVAPGLIVRTRQRLRQALGLPPDGQELMSVPSGWRGLPTKGTIQILALLIDFKDFPHLPADTPAAVQDKIFGSGDPNDSPYESLTSYYRRSSYNQLNIQGDVLGWYTTTYNRNKVFQFDTGRENLIKEALKHYADQGVDFSKYDNDGDGVIDYFMVFWAGTHGDWGTFWWAYQTSFLNKLFTLSGKHLGDYSWQWETRSYPSGVFNPQTVIHETGHALGLPDYYDYDISVGPKGGLGGLDMMDNTSYDHNCFSKFLLDWLMPVVYRTGAIGISLPAAADAPEAVIILPRDAPFTWFAEYFMVQNRIPAGNDLNFPGSGLLIWHVDARTNPSGWEFLYDNSYTDHKLLKLMEADGLEQIEQGGTANVDDFYRAGSSFGPTTIPDSSLYSGEPNGLGINNITSSPDPIGFDIIDVYNDLTPPTGHPAAVVGIFNKEKISCIDFTWMAGDVADPESGISGYLLEVGTTAGSSNQFNGIVSKNRTKTVSDCENGKTYFARVAAINGNRLVGEWSENSAGVSITLPTLNGAEVEAPSLTFTNPSEAPWMEDNTYIHTGNKSFRCGWITDNQSSAIYTTINGPVKLSFFIKVSSEENYDFLDIYVDNHLVIALSGEIDWASQTIELPAGPHLVKWAFDKNRYYNGGLNSV